MPQVNPNHIILLSRTDSYRTGPFQQAADRLGIEVAYGIDMDPQLAEYWQAPLGLQFSEPAGAVQKIVDFAQNKPVQAVIALDDSAALLAALANRALGLPHNSSQAALAARNKYHMRTAFAEAGLSSPQFELYHIAQNPAKISPTITYPVVIKPLLLSGSRGVIRVNHPPEFEAAFARLAGMLKSMTTTMDGGDNILVEDYIPGGEVALEGILSQGQLTILALFDKPDPLEGPFFEETIYVTPSRLPADIQTAIANCVEKAVAAIGLHHGPVHAELRVNEQGPWMLEVAGRSIGGLCSETLQFGVDMSLEELILRQAIGEDVSTLHRQAGAQGVMMIPIPEGGILKGITGLAEAEAVPLIDRIEITAKINYPLVPLPEGESYLGFIFASGDEPDQVEAALREAHSKLQFELMPMVTLVSRL